MSPPTVFVESYYNVSKCVNNTRVRAIFTLVNVLYRARN